MRAIVIDCDTGRDDALAIWYAWSQKIPLRAVVTGFGNVERAQVVDNTRRVLAVAGLQDVPVLLGANEPASHRLYTEMVLPRQKTSGNGLCDVVLPEAGDAPIFGSLEEKFTEICTKSEKIDYIVTGPATSLASLCQKMPDLGDYVANIYYMGGKLDDLWAKMPGSDFNTGADPKAVDVILKSGIPFHIIPMDLTWFCTMDTKAIATLQPKTDIGRFAVEIMQAYCASYSPDGLFRFHDPCCVYATQHPEMFVETRVVINTNENDDDFGRISENAEGHKVRIFKPALMPEAIIKGLISWI